MTTMVKVDVKGEQHRAIQGRVIISNSIVDLFEAKRYTSKSGCKFILPRTTWPGKTRRVASSTGRWATTREEKKGWLGQEGQRTIQQRST